MFRKKRKNNTPIKLHEFEGANVVFGQSAEDAILWRIFKHRNNGFYIDVGCFHPTQYSNTFLLHRLNNWNGINIDASSDSIELFKSARPEDININSAVGEKTGKLTLHKFKHPARNTLSQKNIQRQMKRGDTEIIGSEEVEVKTLKSLLDKYLPNGKEIDLLNIDIEGYDFQALKSNDWDKYKPKVVLVEDYDVFGYSGKESIIYTFLDSKGYILISHNFDTSVYAEKKFWKSFKDNKKI